MQECKKCGTTSGSSRHGDLCSQCYCQTLSDKYTCKACGRLDAPSRWTNGESLAKVELCHGCHFWVEKLALRNENTAIINGHHYHVGRSMPGHGLGGGPHIIEFFDGRRVKAVTLWCQGEIPAHMIESGLFENNARFAKEGA